MAIDPHPEQTIEIHPSPEDPNWEAAQDADRRARLASLKVTRGKNGQPPAEATRLTVAQAHAYHTSALKEFELAVRSGKDTDIMMRRLEVEAAVIDLMEAARFEQVILDLRDAMREIENRGSRLAPPAPLTQPETGG